MKTCRDIIKWNFVFYRNINHIIAATAQEMLDPNLKWMIIQYLTHRVHRLHINTVHFSHQYGTFEHKR